MINLKSEHPLCCSVKLSFYHHSWSIYFFAIMQDICSIRRKPVREHRKWTVYISRLQNNIFVARIRYGNPLWARFGKLWSNAFKIHKIIHFLPEWNPSRTWPKVVGIYTDLCTNKRIFHSISDSYHWSDFHSLDRHW
jgi:hypothetical protein